LFAPTLNELVLCVEREIRLRERVYPRRVREHRMSQDAAERELELMRAVKDRLLLDRVKEGEAG